MMQPNQFNRPPQMPQGPAFPPNSGLPQNLPPEVLQQLLMQQQMGAGRPAPMTQQLPQQQLPAPGHLNPHEIVRGLSEDEMHELQDALIDEYRKKHPELGEYELYISAEIADVVEEAWQKGARLTQREALEIGINRFKQKFMKAAKAELKQSAGNPKDVNRMAMKMDVNSTTTPFAKLSAEDIWNMPREQFLELDRRVRQQHYR